MSHSCITRDKSQRLLYLNFFLQNRRGPCLLSPFYLLSLPDSLLQNKVCLVSPGIRGMSSSPKKICSWCSLSLLTASTLSQTGPWEGNLLSLCGQSGCLVSRALASFFEELVLAESLTHFCFPTSVVKGTQVLLHNE